MNLDEAINLRRIIDVKPYAGMHAFIWWKQFTRAWW